MKNYYRIMLGSKSAFASECYSGSFIGADFDFDNDLSADLNKSGKEFSQKYIPIFLKSHPEKSKIAAGLACGMLWTIIKGINNGDIVLCPNGTGSYYVGEVTGNYYYVSKGILPHRRNVRWFPKTIERSDMSDQLKNSTGSIGTLSYITDHSEEIEKLLGNIQPVISPTGELVEDSSAFAMETHLEDFLVTNWKYTELGKDYEIYEDENGTGKQYQTDDKGRIDILAISKDKKELLVIELKRGRASDVVVGQVQRYMGFVKEVIAEEHQLVKGLIIALEDDRHIRRALSVTTGIDFYRYEVKFKLLKP